MRLKLYVAFFLFLFSKNTAEGIQPTLPYDTLLLDSLLDLAYGMARSQPDSAIFFSEKIMQTAAKNEDDFRLGESYLNIGAAHLHSGDFAASEPFLEKAEKHYRAAGRMTRVATVYMYFGTVYKRRSQLAKALEYQTGALKIRQAENASPTSIGACFNNIGNLYREMEDYPAALDFMKKAVASFSDEKNKRRRGMALGNVAIIFSKSGQLDSAEYYYRMALDLHREMGNQQEEGRQYLLMGEMYFDHQLHEQAEVNLLRAENLLATQSNRFLYCLAVELLGKVKYERGNYREAVPFLRQSYSLATELGATTVEKNSSIYLANALAETGRAEEAFPFLQRHTELVDSIFKEELAEKIAEQKTKFETERKEQEIANLEKLEAQRTRERNISFAGTFLLGLLGLALLYFIFLRKKAYSELLAEKEKSDQLLDDLTSAQKQLVQSEKMASLGQLTAGVAHEINNPINYISSSVEALKFDFADLEPLFEKINALDENAPASEVVKSLFEIREKIDLPFLQKEMAELIGSIEKGAGRTQEIVSALKAFSRNPSGKFLPADLHEGIESSLVILNHKIKAGVTVRKDFGELPPVPCHASRINQVFLNLLDNAIHAAGRTGHILIKTWSENGLAKVSIRDTGMGMEEATRKRIFEPFFTTKEIGEGTGLGLSISYGIVKDHGGEIEVNSKLGEGTEFVVTLPF